MCAVIEIAQQRLKEVPQLPELLGAQDLAGVEHDCFQARPLVGHPRRGTGHLTAETVQRVGQAAGELADLIPQRPGADQQRPFDGPQTSGLPALQVSGGGQTGGLHQAPTHVGVGEINVAI
ncbi:hypothetical protein ALQ56_00404 [Pseudomonas syringae pv. papulans]|nr:hypothetical protein ALQ56_00404 [Pseudomonas syringae pv. papulans]